MSLLRALLFFTFGLGTAGAAPTLSITSTGNGTLGGDYTTSKLFIDEIRGDAVPLTIAFAPGDANLTAVEIVTNLNQRDRVTADKDGNGIEDSMQYLLDAATPGLIGTDDTYYWKKYTPSGSLASGNFSLTLNATRTGAYRLTARWKVSGDTNWRWWTDGAANRRDHAITVSPEETRKYIVYEINAATIEASGTTFATRSTLQDLSDRPGAVQTAAGRANNFNLAYLSTLGVNTLWFQPWHPFGWENRHLSAADINARTSPSPGVTTWKWNAGAPTEDAAFPYATGSPYAVKNFFEVEPRLSGDFTGDPANQADVSSAANRARAMTALQNMVADADAAGLRVMPDAAFNHAAADVELGPFGSKFATAGNPGPWPGSDRIDGHERRVFSRQDDYWRRADLGFGIAPAPDRYDFGKWLDARDLYFGRYAALWRNSSSTGAQQGEGDWFDYTAPTYNDSTGSGGAFDSVTRGLWSWFAAYVPYWLEKTRPAGQNRNSTAADGSEAVRRAWDARGIDGLRCDFAQGLPPQAWEYIINVARGTKWNFAFMAESLDGGAVTYRSNRHFDILNESILFAAKSATTPNGLRTDIESRRASYGQGLVLLNTTSHDEQNYNDPWLAFIRYACFSSMDGAPMIFPGQEMGLSDFYGYDLMEKNSGKYIPHFKTWNSLMPLWTNTDYGLDQLSTAYRSVNLARSASPALRSPNRYFLAPKSGGVHADLFAVAKYETAFASPATSDVVIAFVNFNRNADPAGTFEVNVGGNLLGLKAARRYNVKNLSARTQPAPYLWGAGTLGSDVLANGVYAGLNRVPAANATAWSAAPHEAQFLKVYDTTPPPAPVLAAPAYALSPVTVSWTTPGLTSDDVVTSFDLGGSSLAAPASAAAVTLPVGLQTVSLKSVSAAGISSTAATASVRVLNPAADDDSDGASNLDELIAGTSPLDPASLLAITSLTRAPSGTLSFTFPSVAGRKYTLRSSTTLTDWFNEDEPGSVNFTATGPTTVFQDLNPGGTRKFYRVVVTE